LAEVGLSLPVYLVFFLGSITVLFLVYFIVALLIFLRRPNDGFALFTAIFLLGFGASNAHPQFVEFFQFYLSPPAWYLVPFLISTLCSWTLLTSFLVLYPDGQFVPRWTWVFAIVGFLATIAWAFFPGVFEDGGTLVGVIGALLATGFTAAACYAQFWRYKYHSSPLQRQQTKWFVFALVIFFISTVLSFVYPEPSLTSLSPGSSIRWDLVREITVNGGFLALPVAVGIAILRYRLWDIDIIIRKTLTYSAVILLLLLVYFSTIILLQQLFASVVGQHSEVITVLSTLAIAALFVPLRNRIQAFIDRRFYRKKYDAQQVLEDFAVTVRDETDLEKLTGRLIQVVNETVQPKSASVWFLASNEGSTKK
jgi:hypothetical protein